MNLAQELADHLHADGRLLFEDTLCYGDLRAVLGKRVDDDVCVSEGRHGRRALPSRSLRRRSSRDTAGTERD